MTGSRHSSERIVIIGGGVAGLSVALRMAQAGQPVTVLEESQLGSAASTRNQGWLHSGAWFAPRHVDLARQCYASLKQVLEFCPQCVDAREASMIYISRENEEPIRWTTAWDQAGIPWQRLSREELSKALPTMDLQQVRGGLRLPDRSFRPDMLLVHLAAAARNAGAEIRMQTIGEKLLVEDDAVQAVRLGSGEVLEARWVIIAVGASGARLFPELFASVPGCQPTNELVALKTHLRAVQPESGCDPFCVMDDVGLNHVPHFGTSVFGTNRWTVTANRDDEHIDQAEIAALERQIQLYFPEGFGRNAIINDWSGVTMQAMHSDQIQPGEAPLPTIVDHSSEPCRLNNVISIFPGRATLWPQLAEQVRLLVLEKLDSRSTQTALPPWVLRT